MFNGPAIKYFIVKSGDRSVRLILKEKPSPISRAGSSVKIEQVAAIA
jgi:hypothetical protein